MCGEQLLLGRFGAGELALAEVEDEQLGLERKELKAADGALLLLGELDVAQRDAGFELSLEALKELDFGLDRGALGGLGALEVLLQTLDASLDESEVA